LSSAVIFANGEFHPPQLGRPWLPPDAVLIAADGGGRHCRALGLEPDILIGDFDSLPGAEVEALERAGAEIVRHPPEKDATDLELALDLALARGHTELIVVGAIGDRWDQSLANFLMLATKTPPRGSLVYLDGIQEARLVRAGEALAIEAAEGDLVSLIPLSEDAAGVTTHGLAYPLKDGRLVFGASRGVSNVIQAAKAEVSVAAGALVCIVSHLSQPAREGKERST
jgi:thiamine pyrophosphokinase